MTAVFISILVFILCAVFIVNSGFLEEYYISHKEQDLLDTYQVVDQALQNETLTTQAVQEIAYQAEETNIDMTVINSDNETVLTTVKDGNLYTIRCIVIFLTGMRVPRLSSSGIRIISFIRLRIRRTIRNIWKCGEVFRMDFSLL